MLNVGSGTTVEFPSATVPLNVVDVPSLVRYVEVLFTGELSIKVFNIGMAWEMFKLDVKLVAV